MTLIVCVDDRLGMAFNKRRQSRDRAVCEDVLKIASGSSIGMDERSSKLFQGMEANIICGHNASSCDFLFLEFSSPAELAKNTERIILYRWNRHYPADLYFDISLDGFINAETIEFPGMSHEKITREVYIRER